MHFDRLCLDYLGSRMTRPTLFPPGWMWPGTGRYRVRRAYSPGDGYTVRPSWRWVAVDPKGALIASCKTWGQAMREVDWAVTEDALARGIEPTD